MSGTAKARRTPGAKVFTKQGWDRRMRDAREASGLSVEEVAKALSLSPSSIRQWEGGHKFPSRGNLEEFAEATNVDMVWLITGYAADELELAEKLRGQSHIPFLHGAQLDALANSGGTVQQWPDAPAVVPSYACSARAFAMEVFGHFNSPEFEAGDIIIIDPAVEPTHNDMALATVGPARSLIFGRYVLRGLDPRVEQQVEQIMSQITERLAKRAEELVDLNGREKAVQLLLEMVKKLEGRRDDGPPDAWLVQARGEPIPIRHSERCILGTMIEHRHSRRTFATPSIIGSQTKA